MAEHVVEDVGLLQIVELVGPADEIAGDEAAVGEMIEEHLVGHQPRHRHHLPAGGLHQPLGQFLEIGDAGLRQPQHVEPGKKLGRRPARQQLRLAREQRVPRRMLLGV